MRQVTLKIKDSKYPFFMELVQNLDFVKISEDEIPDGHKKIVRKRIQKSVPEKLLDWDRAKRKLKFG